jgi:hypothetical protein
MADIVERLRRFGAVVQGRDPKDYAVPVPAVLIIETYGEIERLREALEGLFPHALFLLTQMEDGLSKDPKLLRDRIQKARAALEEKE